MRYTDKVGRIAMNIAKLPDLMHTQSDQEGATIARVVDLAGSDQPNPAKASSPSPQSQTAGPTLFTITACQYPSPNAQHHETARVI